MEMTQEWIDQYNKKCAEFLGKTYKKNMIVLPYKHVSNSNTTGEIWEHCKYHSDWNWIMEVKNKICQMKEIHEFNSSYDSVAKGFRCSILPAYKYTFDAFHTKVLTEEKEATIQAIDQFIDWYNKQKES